ncbi:AAA family ATPase [Alloacidobacterium sp.]|uniref:AAA family ATPase n=1 Tax=Alloacidobacterium sp. TaxID=2951999 RepID=UPI002D69B491|nr:AAA family ATPase [Alloacidobacterium sp.]HYK38275.1 AAA family ATPase [Alloacidobacterium sp.]
MTSALAESQANVTREFPSYPGLDDLPQMLNAEYDVIIIELDSNPEHALELVENICGSSSATVMVHSAQSDAELLVRCMRAGAREFLNAPVIPSTIAEALVRASVRRPLGRPGKRATGKLVVFTSAKGGSGVTTVASNFALTLARESGQSTVLIDLDLPLGNVAIDLGITTQFSTANAIESSDRLDSNLLATLLTKHRSGLSVLAAPDRYTSIDVSDQAVEKLLNIARQDFDYVVVDAGSTVGSMCKTLFRSANIVYLVTQVSISGLRNSNRIIAEFFSSPGGPEIEIVLNRFLPRSLGIDEENITKALTRPIHWKIPSDYIAARRAQNTATPLAMEDSPISQVIRQMARTACGLPATADKKKKFGLF